jgi:hypothetical protein
MSLKLNSSGGGSVLLQEPSTASNRTLTLPDADGTVAIQGGTGVGKVLQVVQATYNTEASTTSNTFADTGITASITPTSATSKILVLYSVGYLCQDGNLAGIRLLRGSTTLQTSVRAASRDHASYMHNEHLDSPATTSSTTYKIQFNKNAGNAFLTCWNSEQPSTITLMEIAA